MATATYTKYRKRRYKEAALLVEITIDPDNILYLSNRYIDLTNYYEGLIDNISGMDQYLPTDGKFRQRGSARIKISNKRHSLQAAGKVVFSDMLLTLPLMGATVVIKQYFDGCALTDCETIFTGKIVLPFKYDEKFVHLSVTPKKDEGTIPTDILTGFDYANINKVSQGAVMPIIYGEVSHDTTSGETVDITGYGCAVLVQHEIDTSATPSNFWLVAGHRCDDIVNTWDADFGGVGANMNAFTTEYAGSGNQAGGPGWRDICYFDANWGPPEIGVDSVDIKGLESYGDLANDPGAGVLLLSPLHCIEQSMRLFLGKYDADFGTSFNTVDTTDMVCRGVIATRLSLSNFLTLFMKNFPIWLYYNRSGQLEYKRWAFNESVTYTERELSYDDDIKLGGVEYGKAAYNSITVNYWRNIGPDVGSTKGAGTWLIKKKYGWQNYEIQRGAINNGDFFASSYITLRKQYANKLLNGALNDSDTTFNIDTGGVEPDVATTYKDLMLIDHELFEPSAYNAGTGALTVYRRAACGTTATSHADNSPVYYLRLQSDNGAGERDGRAGDDNDTVIIRIQEAVKTFDVTAAFTTKAYADPERYAAYLETVFTAATGGGDLDGTYTVSYAAEDNTFTITEAGSYPFKVIESAGSDNLPTVLGYSADSSSFASSQTSDTPSWWWEAAAAYSHAVYGTNKALEIDADLIRGDTLDFSEPCATAYGTRNYLFTRLFRPRKRVRFESSLLLADLELAAVFAFSSDIDGHLKIHGATWANLKWRVIETHRPSMNRLQFLVEEV